MEAEKLTDDRKKDERKNRLNKGKIQTSKAVVKAIHGPKIMPLPSGELQRAIFMLPPDDYNKFKAFCALERLNMQDVMYTIFIKWFEKQNIDF